MRAGAALLAITATLVVNGQTALDSLLERKVVNCDDVYFNATTLITSALMNDRPDSIRTVLDAWRAKCGDIEPVVRTNLLLAFREKQVDDTLYSEKLLDYILHYRAVRKWYAANGQATTDRFSYDAVTTAWAHELQSYYSSASLAFALCEFYGSDTEKLLPRLRDDEWPHTGLAKAYRKIVEEYNGKPELNVAAFLGVWSPTGGIAVFGAHPEVGMQVGMKVKRLNYDMTVAFRTGSSASPYQARRPKVADTLEWTDHFFGGHIGFDVGWDLIARGKHETQLNIGAAYDGIDVFKTDSKNPDRNASASSFDLSAGATYRFYVTPYSYLALQVKYHHVDYSRSGVIDLAGQPFTVRIIYGGLSSIWKRSALETLQYRPRR